MIQFYICSRDWNTLIENTNHTTKLIISDRNANKGYEYKEDELYPSLIRSHKAAPSNRLPNTNWVKRFISEPFWIYTLKEFSVDKL